MPDFPIIDSHLHIYDPAALSYPWMKSVPALDAPHGTADYFASIRPVEVEAAVFVEVDAAAHLKQEEAEFVVAAARAEPRLRGMVAGIAIDRGADTAKALDKLRELPLLRGVRDLIERRADEPGWALRDAFVAGVQSLAALGLSFDLCLYAKQIREATELVRLCPNVSFVLDHIGKPDIKGGKYEPWAEDLSALALLPNVTCKISGVVTEADHQSWQEDQILPYLRHAINCFGYDRVMFGGDWPVSELATSFPRWVALVDRSCAAATPSERRRLFRDNSERFYRI